MTRIDRIAGRGLPLRGHDIDTDRIMPARFLRAITFDGIEQHLFADDRNARAERGQMHPFDDPAYRGARVLLAQTHFGCGSSREHAPQAILRWGIRAVVAESFAEIFAGNSLAIGLVCVDAAPDDLERLFHHVESDPGAEVEIDVSRRRATCGNLTMPVRLPDATREALLTGDWDVTGQLLDHRDAIARTAERLPYINGF